jgi:hypothetical protein
VNPFRRSVVVSPFVVRPSLLTAIGGLAAVSCLLAIPPASAAVVDGCVTTRSSSDFNGDGYDDAAVGDPQATVNGVAGAGAVTVLLGDADGRIGEGTRKLITRASLGETIKAGDHFGYDVALAPTGHNDGCAEILIGAPGVDLPGAADAGMAFVITDLPDTEGTPDLDAFPLTQAEAGGQVEAGDQFGSAVAVTAPTQDGARRLVVGAPGENAGATADAGAVDVWRMDSEPVKVGELSQGKAAPLGGVAVPGTPQAGDRFGASLAVGLLDLVETTGPETGQGLVIGAPGDSVTGHDGAGSVTVLQEKFASASLISQDSTQVPGVAEAGDQFGASLALSAQTGTAARTLAVGAPGEDTGTKSNTGAVTLFTNANERFVPRTAFSQATTGVPGANEAGDRFGASLAFGLRTTTLLVGVPAENVGTTVDAGTVQPVLVPAAPSPLRFSATLTENAPGTAGSIGTDNRFGQSLGSLSGQSENIMTISSPYARRGSVYVLTDGTGLPPRSWVARAGAARFGWAVSN